MFKLKALDHVGLRVRDFDRTLDFYRRLGFTVLRRKGPDSSGFRFAVLQVGSQELNVACRPNYLPRERDENAAGIDHFCLEVEGSSIDEVIQGLRNAGIEMAGDPTERRDGAAVFLMDPDGVRIELQLKKGTSV